MAFKAVLNISVATVPVMVASPYTPDGAVKLALLTVEVLVWFVESSMISSTTAAVYVYISLFHGPPPISNPNPQAPQLLKVGIDVTMPFGTDSVMVREILSGSN